MFFQLQSSSSCSTVHRSKSKIKIKIVTIRKVNYKWEMFYVRCSFFLLFATDISIPLNQLLLSLLLNGVYDEQWIFVKNVSATSMWCTAIWNLVTFMERRTEKRTQNITKRKKTTIEIVESGIWWIYLMNIYVI